MAIKRHTKLVVIVIVAIGMSVFVSKSFSSYPTNGTCAIRKNNTLNRCTNKCTTGVPCQYLEELDFRIIVLTFNRPDSLRKCLSHIAKLDTLGHEVGVDIWIDRSKEGKLDEDTYEISSEFQDTWTCGQVCLHIQDRNAYIIGQWVDAWRPRENTREIALILEDDIDISPLTYKWLKMVDSHFRTVPDIAGYTLQGESVNYIKDKIRPVTNTPKTDNVFIYRLMGTWGFSPKPKEWRDFQDWFHETRKNKTFKPYIPGTIIDEWFRYFDEQGKADSMWEIWPIYFYNRRNLYTVYSNLQKYTDRSNILLETNRREAGLHFSKGQSIDRSNLLLSKWSSGFEIFTPFLPRYQFDGTFLNKTMSILM